jgi:hypothetical protein
MNKPFKSIQQIIVNPYMTFNMDDIYGDRGGVPYPEIEELNVLHFKYNGNNYNKQHFMNKTLENDLIDRVKSLGMGEVNINKINGIGKFMIINFSLYNYHTKIINQYNTYLEYSNKNIEIINNIYQYLEEKVPKQFIGYMLFSQK